MLLYAQIQQRNHGEKTGRLSVTRVLRAFGQAIDEYKSKPNDGESLNEQLCIAVKDSYHRKDKRSRGYPRKKYETQAKPPRINAATPTQRQLAKQVTSKQVSKPLTA
jgi:hypothetical protein